MLRTSRAPQVQVHGPSRPEARDSIDRTAHSRMTRHSSTQLIPAEELEAWLLALAERTRTDPLLAHQEGHFKVEVMRTMLTLGYRLQEGAPSAALAWFAHSAPDDPSHPVWSRGPRIVRCDDGSSDVVVLKGPLVRQLELKTRCDHGTKSGAATREIDQDLARVQTSPEFVFLGVFDEQIFRSFSGNKSERRGRRPANADMATMFPRIEDLPTDRASWTTIQRPDKNLRAGLLRQLVDGGAERVLVVMSQ